MGVRVRKPFYLLACCLLVLAIAADLCFKRVCTASMMARAKRIATMARAKSAALSPQERGLLSEEADRLIVESDRLTAVGTVVGIVAMLLTVLGVAGWVMSHRRGERPYWLVPGMLLLVRVALAFMWV